METIQLQLDIQTLQQAQQIAQVRQVSLEQLFSDLIKEMVENSINPTSSDDPLWGLFADEADLIDEVMESVTKDRQAYVLRPSYG